MDDRRKVGEMRPSQLITTFGPGAIVDLPDLSVLVAGLNHWDEDLCQPIPESRLTARLMIDRILAPPMNPRNPKEPNLPVFRFPTFMVCPDCRTLARYDRFVADRNGVLYCYHKGTEKETDKVSEASRVFPVRFMIACPSGHLSDFPWHAFVHRDKPCPLGDKGRLTLDESGTSGSIRDVVVRCSCRPEKGRSLGDAFGKDAGKVLGRCPGRRPWLGRDATELCDETPRALLRGASNAYFPIVESALAIPPYTRPEFDYLDKVRDQLEEASSFEEFRDQAWRWVNREVRELFTPEQIWTAWEERRKLRRGPDQDLLYPEYRALLSTPYSDPEQDFEVEDQPVPPLFEGLIDRLVQVRRLREVRVLAGFTRIDPPSDITAIVTGDEETRSTARRAFLGPLQPEGKRWLPGIMVRGEGIFFTLNLDAVRAWEERVKDAADAMAQAHKKYCTDRNIYPHPPFPGARYVLLHSLAHALIRQLGIRSGYSTTALRERIYARNTPDEQMAGVLIYTATPDSEGSLGGLVEQGQTDRFGEALWHALQEASYCSSDPLCAEHEPEAHGDLNGAACHACQLLAETCCERSNRFLDRSFLVPTVSNPHLAFFGGVL